SYVYDLIENLLGERSKTLDTDVNDIRPRCEALADETLHKLADLPAFIGEMRSEYSIGPGGEIGGF
ncbi:MAG TPA: hypothetical protein VGM41_20245, partial [Chitinophagaceae bacterium]